MAQHYRVGRLSQEIQREVNDILTKRVRDPRVEGVTITGVEVTGDLQHATIYYSTLSNLASDAEISIFFRCAASGTRTRTTVSGQGILSPSCLPIPPLRPQNLLQR